MGALWQTDSTQAAKVQGSSDPAPLPENKPRPRYARRLFWLIVLMVQVATKGLNSANLRRLSCLSMFWHFLDVIWIGVFTFVYLMGVL